MAFDKAQIQHFPETFGVYLMVDNKGRVLYVGKANNLRQRISQYFSPSGDGREKIPHMIAKIKDIETIVVDNEKEALLLERHLIRKYLPKYNTFLKDNRSYICIRVDERDMWPVVSLVRAKGRRKDGASYFGPYVRAYDARKVLDLLNSVFRFRQCADEVLRSRKRPCILYQMKRCMGPCVDACSKEEYSTAVQEMIRFMEGKDPRFLKEMHKQMKEASDSMEFEYAAELLKKIKSVKSVFEKQRVENVEYGNTDVLAISRYSVMVVLTRMLFSDGSLDGVKNYSFSGTTQTNGDILQTFVMLWYVGTKNAPREVIIPEQLPDMKLVEMVLHENKIRIVVPKRGDKLALLNMAQANANTMTIKGKDVKVAMEQCLIKLHETFMFRNYPKRIECFDTSHIAGKHPVAVMVTYINGEKWSKGYRKYHIKNENVSGDLGAMREVLTRRFKKVGEKNPLPDCIVVDGGRVHLNIVKTILDELDIFSIDVIALSKEEGRHDKGMSRDLVHHLLSTVPTKLPADSSILFLLQRVRDEAHRFAIEFHRTARDKKVLTSELENLIGIGTKKRAAILKHFGSIKRLKKADDSEVHNVEGLTKIDIQTVIKFKNSIV